MSEEIILIILVIPALSIVLVALAMSVRRLKEMESHLEGLKEIEGELEE